MIFKASSGGAPEGPGGAALRGRLAPAPRRPARARFRAALARGHLFAASVRGALVAVALALASCRSGEVDQVAPSAPGAAPPAAAPPRNTTQKASERKPPLASEPWHIPVGPNLQIEPQKGFGPIRFGATQETIERLIGEKCEEKRNEGKDVVCRYSAQAVDFVLRDGRVVQMRGHRLGRPFKPPQAKPDYGIFNGRFADGVAFGMLQSGVRELLGPPKRVTPVTTENPYQTVEVYAYDGFSLEFDRLPTGTVVLGGVILDAPKT